MKLRTVLAVSPTIQRVPASQPRGCEAPRQHGCKASQQRGCTALRQHGFTMVELLIVIVIAGILAVIAIPSMQGVLNNTRFNSALGLVVSDLNQARGEAIKRNGPVLVCVRNAAGTDCGATPTDWRAGWVVCSQGAVANTCAAGTATAPNPLVVRPRLHASLTLAGPAAPVRFNANSSGTPSVLNLGGTWDDAPARAITVAVTGNITR